MNTYNVDKYIIQIAKIVNVGLCIRIVPEDEQILTAGSPVTSHAMHDTKENRIGISIYW